MCDLASWASLSYSAIAALGRLVVGMVNKQHCTLSAIHRHCQMCILRKEALGVDLFVYFYIVK